MNINVAFEQTFSFNPNNIIAPNGTIFTFWFPNDGILNHSVTQSGFDNPCTHLESIDDSPTVFDSGLVGGVQFSINITDDSQRTHLFNCKQVLHCGMGMVGVINAPTSGNRTFEAFTSAAVSLGVNQPTETDQGFVFGGVGAEATAASATRDSEPDAGGSAVKSGIVPWMSVLILGVLSGLLGL
ncbi:hypothetical protein BDV98DRAFT_614842 [Pterulicium gracile]|uniref:Blue (type 1) copper domain-containing protein n=1 Tax=Pterulicium gracile TaxID=1884261 RepID=A0A5C3QY08_9AGAR|nr:hypothetical protein BDV98DRAFT_614842 [Pterula gracilis]